MGAFHHCVRGAATGRADRTPRAAVHAGARAGAVCAGRGTCVSAWTDLDNSLAIILAN